MFWKILPFMMVGVFLLLRNLSKLITMTAYEIALLSLAFSVPAILLSILFYFRWKRLKDLYHSLSSDFVEYALQKQGFESWPGSMPTDEVFKLFHDTWPVGCRSWSLTELDGPVILLGTWYSPSRQSAAAAFNHLYQTQMAIGSRYRVGFRVGFRVGDDGNSYSFEFIR